MDHYVQGHQKFYVSEVRHILNRYFKKFGLSYLFSRNSISYIYVFIFIVNATFKAHVLTAKYCFKLKSTF